MTISQNGPMSVEKKALVMDSLDSPGRLTCHRHSFSFFKRASQGLWIEFSSHETILRGAN